MFVPQSRNNSTYSYLLTDINGDANVFKELTPELIVDINSGVYSVVRISGRVYSPNFDREGNIIDSRWDIMEPISYDYTVHAEEITDGSDE